MQPINYYYLFTELWHPGEQSYITDFLWTELTWTYITTQIFLHLCIWYDIGLIVVHVIDTEHDIKYYRRWTRFVLAERIATTFEPRLAKSPPREATISISVSSTSTPSNFITFEDPRAIACSCESRPPLSIAVYANPPSSVIWGSVDIKLLPYPTNIKRKISCASRPHIFTTQRNDDFVRNQLHYGAIVRKRRTW